MEVSASGMALALALSLLLHAGVWQYWGSTPSRYSAATARQPAEQSSSAPPRSWLSHVVRRLLTENPGVQAYWLTNEIHSLSAATHKPHNNYFVPPPHRGEIAPLVEAMGYRTGVELGVQSGKFAHSMLSRWPSCTKYYLVDLWGHQDNYHDFANLDQDKQESIYREARAALEPWANKTVFVRNYTTRAAELVPDGLDFVYVDARHDFCGVYEDLTVWWPKIRPGGLMAGHDYRSALDVLQNSGQDWSMCANGTRNHGAVMGAVNQFAMLHGLHVSVTFGNWNNDWPSWFVRKPAAGAHRASVLQHHVSF